jgi:hypothetical protein
LTGLEIELVDFRVSREALEPDASSKAEGEFRGRGTFSTDQGAGWRQFESIVDVDGCGQGEVGEVKPLHDDFHAAIEEWVVIWGRCSVDGDFAGRAVGFDRDVDIKTSA